MHAEGPSTTSWNRRLSLDGSPVPPPRTPAPVQGPALPSSQGRALWPSSSSSEASSSLSLRELDAEAEEDGAQEGSEAGGQDYINLLPSHLLLHILSLLDWPSKRGGVYLVCRRWAALCAEPSGLWHRVKLDFSWEGRRRPIRGPALIRWLNRRAPAVRTLCLLRSEPVLTCRTSEAFMGVERFFHDFYPVPVEGMRGLVAGLVNLQELTIESCNDLFIGKTYDALSALTALTRLDLARLRKSILSHPTTFLSSLTRLASLRIHAEDDWHPGWTVMGQFPPEIEALQGLTFLSVSSKGVKHLPPFISRLTALRDVRLCGCALSTLPPEASALSRLTLLNLNSNPLGKGASGDPELEQSMLCLPEQLSALTALQRLELMQCKLKAVPEAVLGLAQLQELMLGFNRLDRLPHDPATLRGLSSLRLLSLFSNRLPTVPKAFGCLTALEELFLDDNLSLEFPEPLDWALALPRLACLSAVKDMEHIEEVPAHSWSRDSLNHLLQLDEALRELRPGRRVVRLHHGYSVALLRDRAW